MEQLAILLKSLNIYAHNSHNLCKGSLFFADHAFLADLYEQADDQYDSVVERMIGLGQTPDLIKINAVAVDAIKALPQNPPENKALFQAILSMHNTICQHIEALVKTPGMYQGTINMLADIADKTEANKYKINQRIK